MPQPPRRNPLGNAVNNYARQFAPGTPPKSQPPVPEKPKQPQEPPLPRQNAKVPPPSPPRVIADKTRSLEFTRVGMLGEASNFMDTKLSLLVDLKAIL